MPNIKNYLRFSLGLYLFLISLLLILLVFLINFLVYKNQNEPFLSSSKLSVNGGNLAIAFNLDKTERTKFTDLAASLGSNWQGETINLVVNEPLQRGAEKFNNLTIYLKPDNKSLRLKSDKLATSAAAIQPLWSFSALVPEDSLVYLETKNLDQYLPQEINNLQPFLGEESALAIIGVKNQLGVVWLKVVKDKKGLSVQVEKLRNTSLESTASSTPQLADLVIETVRVQTVKTTSGEVFYFGQIDDRLVITTGEEVFRVITQVKNRSKGSLVSSSTFNKTRAQLNQSGSSAVFINGNSSLNLKEANLEGLQGLVKFSGQGLELLHNYFTKIETITLVINPTNHLEGVVKFKKL